MFHRFIALPVLLALGATGTTGQKSQLSRARHPEKSVLTPDTADCPATLARALAEAERHLDHLAARAPGQPKQPVSPPRRAFFEFEVERPVVWLVGGPVRDGVPGANDADGRPWMIKLIVDTLGRVELSTTRMLRGPNSESTAQRRRDSTTIVAIVRGWRASPARISGCPAPQLIQVPMTVP